MITARVDGPRLHQPSTSHRPTTSPRRAVDTSDARYLRHWIRHQAVLYGDLLKTVASAPHTHADAMAVAVAAGAAGR